MSGPRFLLLVSALLLALGSPCFAEECKLENKLPVWEACMHKKSRFERAEWIRKDADGTKTGPCASRVEDFLGRPVDEKLKICGDDQPWECMVQRYKIHDKVLVVWYQRNTDKIVPCRGPKQWVVHSAEYRDPEQPRTPGRKLSQ